MLVETLEAMHEFKSNGTENFFIDGCLLLDQLLKGLETIKLWHNNDALGRTDSDRQIGQQIVVI